MSSKKKDDFPKKGSLNDLLLGKRYKPLRYTAFEKKAGAPMTPQPHPLRCETCDHYNGGEYFDKCKNEIFPDNMDSTERQYIKDWISSHGCASHSAASRPAPAALETEHEQYERICKEVSQEQHDATIRNDFLEKAEHLAQTIPDFNRMDYIHLLKESLRSTEAKK